MEAGGYFYGTFMADVIINIIYTSVYLKISYLGLLFTPQTLLENCWRKSNDVTQR